VKMNHLKQEATFGLLASVIALTLVSAIQLVANNIAVYAQTSVTPTITGRCELNSDGRPSMVWSLTNLDPTTSYSWAVFDNDPEFGDWDSDGVPSGVTSHTVRTISYVGQEATLTLRWQDASGNLIRVTSDIVSCAPLTERFDNQGQCIREANTNPSSGIRTEDCKTAFKT
jgi:hypothetical protein